MAKLVKSFTSPLEIVLFILFVFYLVFQVKTPSVLIHFIDSALGMVLVLVIALYLFLYTHPILGILSIFVAYELLRRSSLDGKLELDLNVPIQSMKQYIQDMPSISNENEFKPKVSQAPTERTLEEEVVSTMAPVTHNEPAGYVETSFKPISEDVHGAGSV